VATTSFADRGEQVPSFALSAASAASEKKCEGAEKHRRLPEASNLPSFALIAASGRSAKELNNTRRLPEASNILPLR
jgi:hypothetical protein